MIYLLYQITLQDAILICDKVVKIRLFFIPKKDQNKNLKCFQMFQEKCFSPRKEIKSDNYTFIGIKKTIENKKVSIFST